MIGNQFLVRDFTNISLRMYCVCIIITRLALTDYPPNTIKEISRHTHLSKQEIIEDAIEDYRRKLFLVEANKAFNNLMQIRA